MNEREAFEQQFKRYEGFAQYEWALMAWQAALEWARTQQEPVAWHFEFNNGSEETTRRPFDAENMKRHLEADETCTELYAHSAPVQPVRLKLGSEWTPCMKLPVVVHVRRQREGERHISTREGITPVKPDDLIMRGVSGEEYPIGREIFDKTYTFDLEPAQPAQPIRLSDDEVEQLRHKTFSTSNPFCPCDSKTMRKAANAIQDAMLAKGVAKQQTTGANHRSLPPELEALLPDDFTESKDWRESGVTGRIEWLKAMVQAYRQEIERLSSDLDAMLAKGAVQPAVVEQLVEALDALVHDDGYGCDRPTYLKAKAALKAAKGK